MKRLLTVVLTALLATVLTFSLLGLWVGSPASVPTLGFVFAVSVVMIGFRFRRHRINVAAAFVAGVVIGGVVVGLYSHRVTDREIAGLWFDKELYKTQAATKQLRLLDEGRLDVLRKITKMQMEFGIKGSYQLMVSAHPEFSHAWPHLLSGLSDTEEYLLANDSENYLLAWLQEVNDYVESGAREN